MMYDPQAKFTQPDDGIVIIAEGPTDEEILKAQARIEQGEDPSKVWAEVDKAVAARAAKRPDSTALGEVHVIIEP